MRTILSMSLTVLFAIQGVAPGQSRGDERILTLDEALRLAFEAHPELSASRWSTTEAEENEGVAFSPFLPTLDLEATYTRATGNHVPTPGALFSEGITRSTRSYNFFLFTLNLRQTIWDFGRTLGAYEAARATTKASRMDERASRLRRYSEVLSAYHGVIAAQRLKALAERFWNQAKEFAEKAKQLYEAGARPKIDVMRTETQVAMAEAEVAAAEEARRLACNVLLRAIGLRESFDFRAVPPPVPAPQTRPPDLEEALSEALGKRPERLAMLERIKAQEEELTRIRGDYFPRLFAFGSTSAGGVEIDNLVPNWAVGVGLSYPLFSGLGTLHMSRAQKARIEAMKAALEAYDLAVQGEVESARSRILEASSRILPLRTSVSLAQQTLSQAEERYRLGEGNQIEVLDAQRALIEAEARLVRAEYDLALAWTAFYRAVGRIPEALEGSSGP